MSLGRTIGAARAHAGLSLAELSEATRIRLPILAAMEGDLFQPCRGDFYARANLRNIATELGLAAEPLIQEYDEKYARSSRVIVLPSASPETAPAGRASTNWSALLATALVAVVALGAGRAVMSGEQPARQADLLVAPQAAVPGEGGAPTSDGSDSSASDSSASDSAAADSGEGSVDSGKSKSRSPYDLAGQAREDSGPAPAEEPAGGAPLDAELSDSESGVTVKLAATGTSWVRVTDGSGDTVYRGTVRKGDRRTFVDDRKVGFVAGNPKSVRLVVNGKRVRLRANDAGVAKATYKPA